jgi:hypothetical protein
MTHPKNRQDLDTFELRHQAEEHDQNPAANLGGAMLLHRQDVGVTRPQPFLVEARFYPYE